MIKNIYYVLFCLVFLLLILLNTGGDLKNKNSSIENYAGDFILQYEVSTAAFKEGRGFYNIDYSGYKAGTGIFRPYPPSTSLFYLPFVLFSIKKSVIIFSIINIIITITVFLFLIKLLKVNSYKVKILLLLLFGLYYPIIQNLFFGQINLIILLLLLGALKLLNIEYRDMSSNSKKANVPAAPGSAPGNSNKKISNNIIAACMIIAGLFIKLIPGIFFLYFLIKKKFKMFFICLTVFVLFFVATLLLIDIKHYIFYITKILPFVNKAWITRTINNQSILGFLTRIFTRSLEWKQVSYIYYCPKLIKPVYIITVFILTFFYIRTILKSSSKIFDFSFTITYSILLLGVNWDHTYSLLIFPFFYLIVLISKSERKWFFIVLLFIAYILMEINVDFSLMKVYGFIHFLSIHRVYGNLILFILHIYAAEKSVPSG